MEKQSSPAKTAVPYGIVFGVIMVLEFVVSYTMGINAQETPWVGVLMTILNYIVLPVIFIYLACTTFKNKFNGGYISFSQCIKAGVTVGILAGLVFAGVSSIIYMAAPQIKEDILTQTKEALAASPGMTAESMRMGLSVTEMFMKPYISIPATMLIYTLVGLIVSLIIGAIVKKDNPGAF